MLWAEIVKDAILIFGFIFLVVGIWIGVAPQKFLAVNNILDKWISLDEIVKKLDKKIHFDADLLKHKTLMSIIFVIGAIIFFVLYFLI